MSSAFLFCFLSLSTWYSSASTRTSTATTETTTTQKNNTSPPRYDGKLVRYKLLLSLWICLVSCPHTRMKPTYKTQPPVNKYFTGVVKDWFSPGVCPVGLWWNRGGTQLKGRSHTRPIFKKGDSFLENVFLRTKEPFSIRRFAFSSRNKAWLLTCDEIWPGPCYSNVSTCKCCSRNRLSCFDCIPCVQLICPCLTEKPYFIFHPLTTRPYF